jgi:N utilization substance protein A
MMDLKTLAAAVNQIATEKGIEPEKVLGAIESAIAAAYKKEYRKKTEVVRARFDMETGKTKFFQVKTVVLPEHVRIVEEGEEENAPLAEEEEHEFPRYNADRHLFLEEAKKIKSDAMEGEEIEFPLEAHDDFGRIAAQTAKQVVLQSIRDAERSSIYDEFKDREGQIVSGTIERFDRGNVYVNLGRAVGLMFYSESIPSEHYKVGERMRFYVLAVQQDTRRPGIILSRAHPKFVEKLFALEIPEVADGIVEIKGISREPGSRTKIAVWSEQEGVDPVGSAVGQRGMRIMAITGELGMEKIDIIPWSEDAEKYVGNALSPAKVKAVEILPRREAKVFVPDDQLSLAIGRGGQNVRLAARLTGWKIDVRSQSNPDEVQEGGIAQAPEATPVVDGEAVEEKNETNKE